MPSSGISVNLSSDEKAQLETLAKSKKTSVRKLGREAILSLLKRNQKVIQKEITQNHVRHERPSKTSQGKA